MKKKLGMIISVLAIMMFLATGCGSKDAGTTPDAAQTPNTEPTATAEPVEVTEPAAAKELFVMGIDGDPTNNINATTASGRYDLMATKAMFSPLFVINADGSLEYFLATDVQASEDGLTYTAKLREGVKWHDGEPFTADDVVFTYNTIIKIPTANGHDVLQFDGNPLVVEKVDDYTVKFVFPHAIPYALELLSQEKFIVPEHIWAGEEEFKVNPKNANPIGTGPYKFSSYSEGDNLTLVKNEDYFLGEPEIDTVVFKIVMDANAALIALQNGELDALSILPIDVEKLDASKFTIAPYTENRIGYMSAVVYRENMDNKDFRKAILYAINKEDLITSVYVSEEYARNPHSFLPENATFSTEDVEPYGYNLEKSAEYLAKSGVKNPKVRLAYVANNQVYETQGLLIQANLNSAGIECELVPLDAGAMYNNALYPKTADFDLFMGGYIMGIDPDNYATLFVSDGEANFSGIENAAIDKDFNEGKTELDVSKREAIYVDLQKTLIDEAFFLPLTENKRIIAVSKRIGGIDAAKLVPIFTFEDMSKLFEVK